MWFALTASCFAVAVVWWWFQHRNPYFWLRPNRPAGVRHQIVFLSPRGIASAKLRNEIKIFNRLHLVLPTVRGVAVVYTDLIQKLLTNPRFRPGADPYERLFYGYACAVLGTKTTDETIARQLRLNLLWLFMPTRKLVRRGKFTGATTKFNLYPHYRYHLLGTRVVDTQKPDFRLTLPVKLTCCPSYLRYAGAGVTVKQFADYYELQAEHEQTLTLVVAPDKSGFDCRVTRGTVTVRQLATGKTRTYAVRGTQVRLGTSVCAPTDALEIYVTWQGVASIRVNRGRRRLLTTAEVAEVNRHESLIDLAYRAQFIRGEKLRARYQVAVRCVPSLRCLTRVHDITSPELFLAVVADLPLYQHVATLLGGLNLVFIYSGANPAVADLVAEHLSAETVARCRENQLLLYFLDRTVTEPDALYFFTKMAHPEPYQAPVVDPTVAVARSFPLRRTVTVTNPSAKPRTITTVIPLVFTTPSVVTAQGNLVTAVGLFTGKTTVYRLPVNYTFPGEQLTTHLNIPLKCRLGAFEEQTYQITRGEATPSRAERQRLFLNSLSEIVITTADKKLNQIFGLPVGEETDPALLALVKTAHRQVDRKLLISLLEDKHALPGDVWQYLLTKVVGLKWRQDQIHLIPDVNLLGDFRLECCCHGQKHTFNTRKDLANDARRGTILYG